MLLVGIVFVGFFVVIMLMVDGFFNIGVVVVVYDILMVFCGCKFDNEFFWVCIGMVIIVVIVLIFVIYLVCVGGEFVVILGVFGWGMFVVVLVLVVVIGFNWKCVMVMVCNVVIVVSLIFNFIIKVGGIVVFYGIDVGVLLFIVLLMFFFGIFFVLKLLKFDLDIEVVMDI